MELDLDTRSPSTPILRVHAEPQRLNSWPIQSARTYKSHPVKEMICAPVAVDAMAETSMFYADLRKAVSM